MTHFTNQRQKAQSRLYRPLSRHNPCDRLNGEYGGLSVKGQFLAAALGTGDDEI